MSFPSFEEKKEVTTKRSAFEFILSFAACFFFLNSCNIETEKDKHTKIRFDKSLFKYPGNNKVSAKHLKQCRDSANHVEMLTLLYPKERYKRDSLQECIVEHYKDFKNLHTIVIENGVGYNRSGDYPRVIDQSQYDLSGFSKLKNLYIDTHSVFDLNNLPPGLFCLDTFMISTSVVLPESKSELLDINCLWIVDFPAGGDYMDSEIKSLLQQASIELLMIDITEGSGLMYKDYFSAVLNSSVKRISVRKYNPIIGDKYTMDLFVDSLCRYKSLTYLELEYLNTREYGDSVCEIFMEESRIDTLHLYKPLAPVSVRNRKKDSTVYMLTLRSDWAINSIRGASKSKIGFDFPIRTLIIENYESCKNLLDRGINHIDCPNLVLKTTKDISDSEIDSLNRFLPNLKIDIQVVSETEFKHINAHFELGIIY